MGIVTHPDQEAKAREWERSTVMFPKGPHQMVAYCYGMEGVSAYERSIHARMIDMAESGDIEPFDPLGINLSGLTTLEKRGECAGLRDQVEQLCDHHELCYLRARFGLAELRTTLDGMVCFAGIAHEEMCSGRRTIQRGMAYIADVVQLVLRPGHNPDRCNVMSVARKHQVQHQQVSRDSSNLKKVYVPIERSVLTKIQKKFGDGRVLPLNRCAD